MLRLFLIAVLLIFAIQSLRARALLTGALWLAGASALSSVLFFLYGAWLVAVVELSVGAGLVTVLFVFAINIAGDEAVSIRSVPPRGWMAALAVLFILLLGWFVWPSPVLVPSASASESPLAVVLWQDRGLDLMVQVVLIFSGVLGLLGLLAEARAPLEGSMAREVAAGRDREMRRMESQALQAQEAGQ